MHLTCVLGAFIKLTLLTLLFFGKGMKIYFNRVLNALNLRIEKYWKKKVYCSGYIEREREREREREVWMECLKILYLVEEELSWNFNWNDKFLLGQLYYTAIIEA